KTTGIVQFRFPDDIKTGNTILPADLYWIKASLSANTGTTSRTVAIAAQAGLATYAKTGSNDPLRPAAALDKDSITKLVTPDANIIKVGQPFPSFGGSAPEDSGNAYVTRVSELLRHKGRAVQKWDYERLVLQAFPKLSRAKCINHSLWLSSSKYMYDL